MSISICRAASIGAIGGIAAFIAFGPAAPHGAQLFVLLIGWAGYSHFGGKLDGLKRAVSHYLFGALLAALALVLATQLPYGEPLGVAAWSAIAIAVTLAALAFVPKLPTLSDISGALLGYAAVLGQAAAGGGNEKIVALAADNPLLVALASLILGAVLALLAESLAETIQKLPLLRRSPAQSVTRA
jgi:hypothetical protein